MAVLTVEPFDIIDPAATGLDSRALCQVIEQRYRELFGYAVPTTPAVPTLPSAAADAPQPLGDLP
jgi:hypothetical protein